jgi:hypothetical protein
MTNKFLGLKDQHHSVDSFFGTRQLLKGTPLTATAAVDRHRMNIHMPLSIFHNLKALQAETGMSQTEFMIRITQQALADYEVTGTLPPKWRF